MEPNQEKRKANVASFIGQIDADPGQGFLVGKVKWGGRNPPNVLVSIKPIHPGIFVRLGCLGRSATTSEQN